MMEILGVEHPYETESDLCKEIKKRWDALGFTDGLSGKTKEMLKELFESENKPLPKDEQVTIDDLPLVKKVWARLNGIE